MTRQNASQFLPLVQAYADGKTIQCNDGASDNPAWRDLNWFNCTDEPSHYRIKPEPRERWIYIGDGRPEEFSDRVVTHKPANPNWIHFREVLP